MEVPMTAIDRFVLLTRSLRKDQQGMAVATALVAMTIAFTFASAAVVYSVNTQRGTVRDHDTKEAIAAADAGANVALMRLNQFSKAVSTASPCIGMSGTALVVTKAEADGWCPQINGTVGKATYSYRVGPSVAACTESTSCVVALGTSDGVSRRVEVTLGTTTVGGAFSRAGVIGNDDIVLDNNADIRVGVGTNGNVKLSNSASICGDIRYGTGKKLTFEQSSSQCSGYVKGEGNETLPQVSSFMPSTVYTASSNKRLEKCTSTGVPAECQSDSYTKAWETNVPWNRTTRTIEPAQNSTLTLTGGDYFICRLYLGNNSHLIMGAGAAVRIFFDTPEACKMNSGEAQILVENNADITSSGYQVGDNKYSLPGLYVMGSSTIQTKIIFANNSNGKSEESTNQFVLYAPNSNVYLENNATFKGAIAGKTVYLSNHAKVVQDEGFKPPPLGGSALFTRQSYVECIGATASPPNASC
ncbi:MAG TPA: hypothetical protein VN732_05510 [Solirubrobacterales bacterium]|nr:hypothetical protein [Solirubrobacterales bacterium]